MPADALNFVLDAIHSGETVPQAMVIVWNEADQDGVFQLRYMVSGDATLTGTIGMLELTKMALTED